MPMVEVDEQQLVALQGTAKTVQAMLNHPKARALLRQAEKEYNPNAVIPEIDAAAPVLAEVKKLNERLEANEKAQRERDEKAADQAAKDRLAKQWEKGRADLKSEGYTEEGISAIEKLMETEGIANHKAAAAYHDRLNPPPPPVEPVSTRFNPFIPANEDEGKLTKMLMDGNDEGFLNVVIPKVLGESRGRR